MEVLAALFRERQGIEEKIHQARFSAADAAPQIEATNGLATLARDLRELRAPAARRRGALQVAIQALERLDGARLRRIGGELAAFDALPIECERAGHACSSGRSKK